MDFVETVKELLVAEHRRTPEEAEALVKRFPKIMVNAMMMCKGPFAVSQANSAAFALQIAEDAGHDAPINMDT